MTSEQARRVFGDAPQTPNPEAVGVGQNPDTPETPRIAGVLSLGARQGDKEHSQEEGPEP